MTARDPLAEAEARLVAAHRSARAAGDSVRAAQAHMLAVRKRLGIEITSPRSAISTIPRGEVFSIQRVADLAGCTYATAGGICRRLYHQGRLGKPARGSYVRLQPKRTA